MALHNMGGPQPGRKAVKTKAKPTESKKFGQKRPSLNPCLLPPAPQSSTYSLNITWASHCFCLCLSPPICSQTPRFCPPLYLQMILYDPLSKEGQELLHLLHYCPGQGIHLQSCTSEESLSLLLVLPGGLTELLSTLPSLTSSMTGSTLPEEIA